MEGPYLVELTSDQDGRLRLVCKESGLRDRIVAEETVDLLEFATSLLLTSDDVLTFCEERGWRSTDCDTLARSADSLREEIGIDGSGA